MTVLRSSKRAILSKDSLVVSWAMLLDSVAHELALADLKTG